MFELVENNLKLSLFWIIYSKVIAVFGSTQALPHRISCVSQFFCVKCTVDFEDDGEDESDGGWQLELQRRYAQEANFMAELRARQATSPPELPPHNQNFGPGFQHPNFPPQGPPHGPGFFGGQNHVQYGPPQAFHGQGGPSQNPGPFGHQVGSPFW